MSQFVAWQHTGRGVMFRLTEEGRDRCGSFAWRDPELPWHQQFRHFLEEVPVFEEIAPQDVGALTDAPIISDVAVWDDSGHLVCCDTVYWFPAYAVTDPLEHLVEYGFVFFPCG